MQEDMKGEQKVNGGWGIQRDLIGGVGGGSLCGPSVHLTSHLGNTVSRLVQEQEDYIWRGIRFLKTKGCVFRLLPISPLRFFCSRVANVFTRDAGRVFLISSPLSLGDFLCVVARLLCVKKEGGKKECAVEKMRGNCVSTYVLECESLMRECVVGSLHREVILAYRASAALRSVQGPSLQVSLPCRDMKTINLTADLTTAPQDEYLTCSSLPGSKILDFDRDCI